jgi:hypothetical protein
MMKISIERLHELLVCNPYTGVLFWKNKKDKQGSLKIAGGMNGGYIQVRVDYADYRAHNIIFAMHYGRWPAETIDHINHLKTDNRISNLREATHVENCYNRPRYRGIGYKGVRKSAGCNTWQAQITANKKWHHLGQFKTPIEAAIAYDKAAILFHGNFACLNFPLERQE